MRVKTQRVNGTMNMSQKLFNDGNRSVAVDKDDEYEDDEGECQGEMLADPTAYN